METKSVSTQTLDEFHSVMDCPAQHENKETDTSNNAHTGLVSDCKCFHNVPSSSQDCSCKSIGKSQSLEEVSCQQIDSVSFNNDRSQYEKDISLILQSNDSTSTPELFYVLCNCDKPHYMEVLELECQIQKCTVCHKLAPGKAKYSPSSSHEEKEAPKLSTAFHPTLNCPLSHEMNIWVTQDVSKEDRFVETNASSQKKSCCCQTQEIGIDFKIKCSPTPSGTQCQLETRVHAACGPSIDSHSPITLLVPCQVELTENEVTPSLSILGNQKIAPKKEMKKACEEPAVEWSMHYEDTKCRNYDMSGMITCQLDTREDITKLPDHNKPYKNDACIGNSGVALASCKCQTSNPLVPYNLEIKTAKVCPEQKRVHSTVNMLPQKISFGCQTQDIDVNIKCSPTTSGTQCYLKTQIHTDCCGPNIESHVPLEPLVPCKVETAEKEGTQTQPNVETTHVCTYINEASMKRDDVSMNVVKTCTYIQYAKSNNPLSAELNLDDSHPKTGLSQVDMIPLPLPDRSLRLASIKVPRGHQCDAAVGTSNQSSALCTCKAPSGQVSQYGSFKHVACHPPTNDEEVPIVQCTKAVSQDNSVISDPDRKNLNCILATQRNKITDSLFCVSSQASERMIFYEESQADPVNKNMDASTETCVGTTCKCGREKDFKGNSNDQPIGEVGNKSKKNKNIDKYTQPDSELYKDEASQVNMSTEKAQPKKQGLMVDQTSKTMIPERKIKARLTPSCSQIPSSVKDKLSLEVCEAEIQTQPEKRTKPKAQNQNVGCHGMPTKNKYSISHIKGSRTKVSLKNCPFSFPDKGSLHAGRKFKKKPLKIIKLKESSQKFSPPLSKSKIKPRNKGSPCCLTKIEKSEHVEASKQWPLQTSRPVQTCVLEEMHNSCLIPCQYSERNEELTIKKEIKEKPAFPGRNVANSKECSLKQLKGDNTRAVMPCSLKNSAACTQTEISSSHCKCGALSAAEFNRTDGYSQTEVPGRKHARTETGEDCENPIVFCLVSKCIQVSCRRSCNRELRRNKCSKHGENVGQVSKCKNVSIILQTSKCKECGVGTSESTSHKGIRSVPVLKICASHTTSPPPCKEPQTPTVKREKSPQPKTVVIRINKAVETGVARNEHSAQTTDAPICVPEMKPIIVAPLPTTLPSGSHESTKSYGLEPVEKEALINLAAYSSYDSLRPDQTVPPPKRSTPEQVLRPSKPKNVKSNDSIDLTNFVYLDGGIHSIESLLESYSSSSESEGERRTGLVPPVAVVPPNSIEGNADVEKTVSSPSPASQRSTVFFQKEEGTTGITFKNFIPDIEPRKDSLESNESILSLVSLHSSESVPEVKMEPLEEEVTRQPSFPTTSRGAEQSSKGQDSQKESSKPTNSEEKPETEEGSTPERKGDAKIDRRKSQLPRHREPVPLMSRLSSGSTRSEKVIKCRPYGKTKPVCTGKNVGYCIEEVHPNPDSSSGSPIFLLQKRGFKGSHMAK